MTKVTRWLFGCAVCLSLVWVMGCDSGSGLAPVTGTVKFADGSPLTQGEIIFSGKDSSPRGQIKSNGSFTLYTGEEAGAAVGSYQVFITGVHSDPDAGGYQPPDESGAPPESRPAPVTSGLLIDEKFTRVETSGITQEVKSGKNNFDIVVEKPGAAPAAAEETQ